MFRHAVRTLLALAVAMAPASADAALYRWVDELGVTHYTTDLDAIPSDARDNALEIIASPPPSASTRAVPVPPPPAPAEVVAPESLSAPAPELAAPAAARVPAPAAAPEPAEPAPAPPALAPVEAAPPEVAPVEPAPAVEPADESRAREIPSGDPRAAEVAELEAKIAADREQLRQMISTKRWDSAELASDPSIRAIAERLPRLQAELAALRAETVQ